MSSTKKVEKESKKKRGEKRARDEEAEMDEVAFEGTAEEEEEDLPPRDGPLFGPISAVAASVCLSVP